MAKTFSGSTIKSWFQYRCERKTRYELFTDAELNAVPVAKVVKKKSWADEGVEFENRVVAKLHREQGVLQPSRRGDPLEEKVTAAFLQGRSPKPFAAQANLTPNGTPAFLAGTDLALKRNLPDLIRRAPTTPGGRPVFTIIDVKATRRATAFHKTQVAFYVRVLETLLAEMDLPAGPSLDDQGEIWRIPDDGFASGEDWAVERFALAPYLRLVDDFCANILPGIAKKVVTQAYDETFFHLYFKCEQCDFIDHCLKSIDPEKAGNRDVSVAPGLTHEGKRSLHKLNIRSVSDLAQAAGLATRRDIGWSLSRRAPLLVARANALVAGTVMRTPEEHTFLMPPKADVAFLVVVDHDPVDDRIAAIGYRKVEAGRSIHQRIEVPRSSSLADEAAAIIQVLAALIEDLAALDRINSDLPDGEGVYAHIFFYEPAEATTLQRAIGRHLDHEMIRNGLLHLVRLFPPEDMVPEPEFRGMHHLPATAIRSVVEQLFALPVSVSHDLRQVSRALAEAGGGPAYVPQIGFYRQFSSLLSIDVIRPIREGDADAPSIEAVKTDVAARIDALQGVVSWLFARSAAAEAALGKPLLRLAKKPFRFQATFDPLNAVDLDVLVACELLENRAGLLEALINLAQPSDRRRDAGRSFARLKLRNHAVKGGMAYLVFEVPEASRNAELGPGSFSLILTNDDPDLRLDMSNWPQCSCRILPPSPDYPDRPDRVAVSMPKSTYLGQTMQALLRDTPDGGWHIDQAFGDMNTARAAAFLSSLGRP